VPLVSYEQQQTVRRSSTSLLQVSELRHARS